MHQQRLTRLLSRRQERQLWLVLLTLIMAANVFLLLFLHSPWVPPGPLVLDYPHHIDSRRPAFQPDHDDLNSRGRLQSRLKVKDRTGGGELPQHHATRKPEGIREKVADNAQDFSDSREPELKPEPERGVSKNMNQEPSLSRELEPKPKPERAVSKDTNQVPGDYPGLEPQPKRKQIVASKDMNHELGDYPEPDPNPKLKQTASEDMDQGPPLSRELEPKPKQKQTASKDMNHELGDYPELDPKPKLKQTASKGMDPYKKLAAPRGKPVKTMGEKILKSTKNTEDKKKKELRKYAKPTPKPQPAKNAEADQNKELSRPGQPAPRPPQAANQPGSGGKTCDQNGTLPLPWLHKPDNLTSLEQVIHSLEVVSDADEESWKTSSYFRPRARVVTTFRPGVLIDSVRCPPEGPRLLILIPSTDVSVRVRQAIRETWASPAYGAPWPGDTRNFTSLLKVVFVLGMRSRKTTPAVEEEARKFRDIVQLDFQESYLNLSLKMALAVEWSAGKCPGAGHVMKTDEDTFVELSLLLDLLQHLSPPGRRPRFVLGSRHCKEKPIVVRRGKWGVTGHQYPFPYFPRYLYGHSYVLSSEAVREVRAVWRHLPLVPNEDAFLTGVVAKVKNITRFHCEWFANDYRKTRIPREELANGRSVTQTGFKPFRTLYTVWEMLKKVYGGSDHFVKKMKFKAGFF